jgi:hypothetical protein
MYKKDKTLAVTCKNIKGETLEVNFLLLNNSLVDRWIALVEKSNEENKTLVVNYQRILNQDQLEQEFQIFVNGIQTINTRYDRQLRIPLSLSEVLNDQKVLNDLHAEYEIYGSRLEVLDRENYYNNPKDSSMYNEPFPGLYKDDILNINMLRLNDRIHNFEAISRTMKRGQQPCAALVDWLPSGLHAKLEPLDYLLFTTETLWGYVYLGYNTLGKNWIAACVDNDIEVVQRNAVKPQKRFAAEFYIEFKLRSHPYSMANRFFNWVNNTGLTSNILDNLSINELAFGSVPLARLYSYKLDNNIVKVDHELFHQDFQKDWNQNIWSRFDNITSVHITRHLQERYTL